MSCIELETPRVSMASYISGQSTAFDPSTPTCPEHRLEGHGERRTSTGTGRSRPQSKRGEQTLARHFATPKHAPTKDRPGWPRLAEVMAQTPEFAAFPRFRELNTRNLLYYQVQLQLLQQQIEVQEEDDELNIECYADLVDEGDSSYHESLMKLRVLLREYNEALLQLARVSALRDPEEYNMRSLRSWLVSQDENGGRGGVRVEAGPANAWGDEDDTVHKGNFRTVLSALLWAKPPTKGSSDLVITNPDNKIDGLTKWMVYYLCPYWWSLRKRQASKSDEEGQRPELEDFGQATTNTVERMSEGTALRITSSLSTIIACLMPVIAIVVLKQLSRPRDLLLCITGFAIIFAAGLIFLTQGTSSRTEIFAATAAFSAVMVVFISDPPITIQQQPGTDVPVILR